MNHSVSVNRLAYNNTDYTNIVSESHMFDLDRTMLDNPSGLVLKIYKTVTIQKFIIKMKLKAKKPIAFVYD